MNSVILEIAYKCSAIASVDLNGIPLHVPGWERTTAITAITAINIISQIHLDKFNSTTIIINSRKKRKKKSQKSPPKCKV